MKRVEEYIKAYTRRCSNELTDGGYAEWLTPDHARSVAVITQEETISKACKWLKDHLVGSGEQFVKDFRTAMEE